MRGIDLAKRDREPIRAPYKAAVFGLRKKDLTAETRRPQRQRREANTICVLCVYLSELCVSAVNLRLFTSPDSRTTSNSPSPTRYKSHRRDDPRSNPPPRRPPLPC